MPESTGSSDTSSFWRSRSLVALLVLGGVAMFFLLEEHRAHVLGFLPYLLILACPLMHLFMHHGHHHDHHHGHGQSSAAAEPESHRHERP